MNIKNFFNIDDELLQLDKEILDSLKQRFLEIDDITEYNQLKVLNAFIKNGVSEANMSGSTGYGYDDRGREILERVMADCMGAEDSIMRHNFVSGTHTLTVALFGILRPNDKVLVLTGRPYDTITGVFGIDSKNDGSLSDFGVEYNEVALLPDGTPDIEEIKNRLSKDNYKMAYIQRSRGYSIRPTLVIDDIKKLCDAVKEVSPSTIIMVDNCYGEFVEKLEPCDVGADLCAGSLIKNPGGGIAPSGGYIAGKAKYVELCSYRFTSVGIGKECGASLGMNKILYQGLFLAPHIVSQAIKTALLCSAVFDELGYEVDPQPTENRYDIIQSIKFGTPEGVIAFCQGIQKGSPVDSFVTPMPWDMPGYQDQVIMAAGAFIQGSSIELSADGPIKPPYIAYMQGGLTYESAKLGVMFAAQNVLENC